jgi:hypothetical protein
MSAILRVCVPNVGAQPWYGAHGARYQRRSATEFVNARSDTQRELIGRGDVDVIVMTSSTSGRFTERSLFDYRPTYLGC